MEEKIRKLLSKVLECEFDYAGTDMFEDGIIDSLEMMALIMELENAFGIEIDGEDIIPENFMTLSTIAEMIERYQVNEQK